jgi:hypothetical protein
LGLDSPHEATVFKRSDLTEPAAILPNESDKRVDEQARGGTRHTSPRGVRDYAEHSLVHAVGSGAVRERDNCEPEQPSKCNADRQSYEAHCPQTAAIN